MRKHGDIDLMKANALLCFVKKEVLPQTTPRICVLIQSESAKHLGIKLHRSLKSSHAVDERIRKARSSVFSLMTNETTYDINPLKNGLSRGKVSIPAALNGSELWSSLTNYDVLTPERFLIFTAKCVKICKLAQELICQ
ncbi:hypothetical protein DPMN_031865 [Dreissena polymorpha]|uniref:Uncharacterized protein n=1 Tax=Dreissena polymorpha TaxID=45954 RepID=A0A9D4M393_DREPO|nr:hypothetical protein DPMN_031865 [Dreissena polymorpha]